MTLSTYASGIRTEQFVSIVKYLCIHHIEIFWCQAVNCGVPEKSHRKWGELEEGIGNRGGGRKIKWKVEIMESGREVKWKVEIVESGK